MMGAKLCEGGLLSCECKPGGAGIAGVVSGSECEVAIVERLLYCPSRNYVALDVNGPYGHDLGADYIFGASLWRGNVNSDTRPGFAQLQLASIMWQKPDMSGAPRPLYLA